MKFRVRNITLKNINKETTPFLPFYVTVKNHFLFLVVWNDQRIRIVFVFKGLPSEVMFLFSIGRLTKLVLNYHHLFCTLQQLVRLRLAYFAYFCHGLHDRVCGIYKHSTEMTSQTLSRGLKKNNFEKYFEASATIFHHLTIKPEL